MAREVDMKLPPEAIAEFQTLWKEYSGLELKLEDAEKQATSFLQVLRGSLAPSKTFFPPSNNGPP